MASLSPIAATPDLTEQVYQRLLKDAGHACRAGPIVTFEQF
jgi:hypothetical protein